MNELIEGFYATRIYLPLSMVGRRWRRFSRRVRGKSGGFLQATRLPEVSWTDCTSRRSIRIRESGKSNGNVRISELAILSALAADCADGTNLFEFGTFDGRTTLNLALNSPPSCSIYTLDLPPDVASAYALAEGERHMVEKPSSGIRYEQYRNAQPARIGKIHQLLGDSATFDYSPYVDSCSLIFIDASHAYDYVMSDTRAAMAMAKKGSVILWHDYGIWGDVTRALEDLERENRYGLRNISGTSLVYWKNLD